MLYKLIEIRSQIYTGLIIILLSAFTVSFAVTSISMFLFVPFFFLDKKENIVLKIRNIRKQKIPILYMLFFLFQLISVVYSENTDFALKRVGVMLPLFFLPAIVSVEKMSKEQFKHIISVAKYTIVFAFIYFIFIHVVIDEKAFNTFVHFTLQKKLGVSQFYIIFILLIPILSSIHSLIKRKNTLLNLIILIVSIGISFLLGNKTMLVFIVLLWLIFIVNTFKRNRKKTFLPLIIGLAFLVGASQTPIIKKRIDVFVKTIDFDMNTIITKNSFTITKNTFEHRLLINSLSIEEIIKALPFGVGIGDTQDILYKQYGKINFKAALVANLNNHNQYLSEFLKTGIIGGVLFIFLLFCLIKNAHFNNQYYIYYISFFAIACMIESYLVRQHGIVIFAFLIPFFLYNDKNTC